MTQVRMEDGDSIEDIRGKLSAVTGVRTPDWWREIFADSTPQPRSSEQRAQYKKKFDFPVDDYYSQDEEDEDEDEEDYGGRP